MSFSICFTPEQGRYVVADKPFTPGEEVMRAEPYAAAIGAHFRNKRCCHCLQAINAGNTSKSVHKAGRHAKAPAFACASCEEVWFCSEECQQTHMSAGLHTDLECCSLRQLRTLRSTGGQWSFHEQMEARVLLLTLCRMFRDAKQENDGRIQDEIEAARKRVAETEKKKKEEEERKDKEKEKEEQKEKDADTEAEKKSTHQEAEQEKAARGCEHGGCDVVPEQQLCDGVMKEESDEDTKQETGITSVTTHTETHKECSSCEVTVMSQVLSTCSISGTDSAELPPASTSTTQPHAALTRTPSIRRSVTERVRGRGANMKKKRGVSSQHSTESSSHSSSISSPASSMTSPDGSNDNEVACRCTSKTTSWCPVHFLNVEQGELPVDQVSSLLWSSASSSTSSSSPSSCPSVHTSSSASSLFTPSSSLPCSVAITSASSSSSPSSSSHPSNEFALSSTPISDKLHPISQIEPTPLSSQETCSLLSCSLSPSLCSALSTSSPHSLAPLTYKHVINLVSNADSLQSNKTRLKEAKHLARNILRALDPRVARALRGDASSTVFQLVCKERCNVFGLWCGDSQCCGMAIYPHASFFNHSCLPNCVRVQDGRHISIRALFPIKQGEELTISYVGLNGCGGSDRSDRTQERRSKLEYMYCFRCACVRCSANGASERSRIQAAIRQVSCPRSGCPGLLLPGLSSANHCEARKCDGEANCVKKVCHVCGTEVACASGTVSLADMNSACANACSSDEPETCHRQTHVEAA